MAELGNLLIQLAGLLGAIGWQIVQILLPWLLLLAWAAWWLWAVDWKRLWPTLAEGAWVPLVLLAVVAALAWSVISPSTYDLYGWDVRNFWWQLGAAGLMVGIACFCGWIQVKYSWSPLEVEFAPEGAHGHDHHGHGHHDTHHAHETHAHGH